MNWDGVLTTSFQAMGRLCFSMELAGYPDVGKTNDFLEALNGKAVRVIVEALP